MNDSAGNIEQLLVVRGEQADQQCGAASVEIVRPDHRLAVGQVNDRCDEFQQDCLVVLDAFGQELLACLVDDDAVVFTFASVDAGPDFLAQNVPSDVELWSLRITAPAVIADSGVFSTMLSELINGPRAGTALTEQTAAGFLLTIVTIQIVPLIAGLIGWRFALFVLAIGPVAGVMALARLRRRQPDPP